MPFVSDYFIAETSYNFKVQMFSNFLPAESSLLPNNHYKLKVWNSKTITNKNNNVCHYAIVFWDAAILKVNGFKYLPIDGETNFL